MAEEENEYRFLCWPNVVGLFFLAAGISLIVPSRYFGVFYFGTVFGGPSCMLGTLMIFYKNLIALIQFMEKQNAKLSYDDQSEAISMADMIKSPTRIQDTGYETKSGLSVRFLVTSDFVQVGVDNRTGINNKEPTYDAVGYKTMATFGKQSEAMQFVKQNFNEV